MNTIQTSWNETFNAFINEIIKIKQYAETWLDKIQKSSESKIAIKLDIKRLIECYNDSRDHVSQKRYDFEKWVQENPYPSE